MNIGRPVPSMYVMVCFWYSSVESLSSRLRRGPTPGMLFAATDSSDARQALNFAGSLSLTTAMSGGSNTATSSPRLSTKSLRRSNPSTWLTFASSFSTSRRSTGVLAACETTKSHSPPKSADAA